MNIQRPTTIVVQYIEKILLHFLSTVKYIHPALYFHEKIYATMFNELYPYPTQRGNTEITLSN